MVKTRICVILLFCAVGLFKNVSCSQSGNTLRLSDADFGYYAVNVVQHESTIDRSDPKNPVTNYYNMFLDGTTKISASYATSYLGLPVYPSAGASACVLQSYTITWRCNPSTQKIPPTSGGLGEVVPGSPDGKSQVTFSIVAVPAATKETCTALVNLEADHSSGVYTNGQLTALGTLTVNGVDLLTGQAVTASAYINALFADYNNDKTTH